MTKAIPVQTVLVASTILCVAICSWAYPESGPTWAKWSRRPEPVFTGQYIASDPCVIRDGNRYRMFYSGLTDWTTKPETGELVWFRIAICQATSKDGFLWEHVPVSGPYEGLMLHGEQGKWDEVLETCYAVKNSDEDYLLYYIGYRKDKDQDADGGHSSLGVARSGNAVCFAKDLANPIVTRTDGGYDFNLIASPTIVKEGGAYYMVYCGHRYKGGENGPGVRLLGATSKDGIHWTKSDKPVLERNKDIAWMNEGVGEPALVKGPDNKFYLFFTGLGPTDVPVECLIVNQGGGRVIGVAQGDTPFGPWVVNPNPIVLQTPYSFDESAAIAPDVLIEGDTVRMWYMGFDRKEKPVVAYAEAKWPLKTD